MKLIFCFNILEAKKSLSPDDVKHYKEIGESMYKDVDFETSTINGENFA